MIEYQSINTVPKETEVTVLSYENTSNLPIDIFQIGIEANARCEWNVYINTIKKIRLRTSVSKPSLSLPLYSYKLDIGDIIDIKAIHYENNIVNLSAEVIYG